MFTATEICEIGIRLEGNAERLYRKAASTSKNAELTALLLWMADEEASHAQWLGDLKQSIAGEPNPIAEEMSRHLLGQIMGQHNFSLKEVDFSRVTTVEELVAVFLEFERDGLLFYEILQSFLEDPVTRQHLETIIAEEERHIERLSLLMMPAETATT